MIDLLLKDNIQEIINFLSYQDIINLSICNKQLNKTVKSFDFEEIIEDKLRLLIKYYKQEIDGNQSLRFLEDDFTRPKYGKYILIRGVSRVIEIYKHQQEGYKISYIDKFYESLNCPNQELKQIIRILCVNKVKFISKYNDFGDYGDNAWDHTYYENKDLITSDLFIIRNMDNYII